jgi:hypothetical protein
MARARCAKIGAVQIFCDGINFGMMPPKHRAAADIVREIIAKAERGGKPEGAKAP